MDTYYRKAQRDQMVDEFDRRRRLIISGLEAIDGFSCTHPRGSLHIFPSIKALGFSSEAFVEFLLSRAQVATVPGPVFGTHGEGYIRFSYSTSYEDIEEGLGRVKEAVRQRVE